MIYKPNCNIKYEFMSDEKNKKILIVYFQILVLLNTQILNILFW